jgi:hypothetical protein
MWNPGIKLFYYLKVKGGTEKTTVSARAQTKARIHSGTGETFIARGAGQKMPQYDPALTHLSHEIDISLKPLFCYLRPAYSPPPRATAYRSRSQKRWLRKLHSTYRGRSTNCFRIALRLVEKFTRILAHVARLFLSNTNTSLIPSTST